MGRVKVLEESESIEQSYDHLDSKITVFKVPSRRLKQDLAQEVSHEAERRVTLSNSSKQQDNDKVYRVGTNFGVMLRTHHFCGERCSLSFTLSSDTVFCSSKAQKNPNIHLFIQ